MSRDCVFFFMQMPFFSGPTEIKNDSFQKSCRLDSLKWGEEASPAIK